MDSGVNPHTPSSIDKSQTRGGSKYQMKSIEGLKGTSRDHLAFGHQKLKVELRKQLDTSVRKKKN